MIILFEIAISNKQTLKHKYLSETGNQQLNIETTLPI